MQGDGEVNQTAVETSIEGEVRLRVRKDLSIDLPFAVTEEHLITMAFAESLDVAARLAMRKMVGLLEAHYGLAFHDAYRLCSVTADMRVTQVVNQNKGVHVMLGRALLRGLGRTPVLLD